MPRGLSSPLATTRRPPAAVAAVAVPAALVAAPNGDCGAADAWPPRAAPTASTSRLPRMPARRNSLCMEISSSRGWVLSAPPGPDHAGTRTVLSGPAPIDPDRPWSVPGVRHHRRTLPLRLVVATIVRPGYPQRRAGAGAAHRPGSRRGPDGDLAPGDLFVDGDDHGAPPIGRWWPNPPTWETGRQIARAGPGVRSVAVALVTPRHAPVPIAVPPVCAPGHRGPRGWGATEGQQS